MKFLGELISKQRYPVLFLLAGLIILFLANYSISGDLHKPQIKPSPSSTVMISIGVFVIILAGALALTDEDSLVRARGCKIRDLESGFETMFRDCRLSVQFGVLQELYQPADQLSVAVLPANEFFDERCFHDSHTAAGAFVAKFFPQQASGLRDLVLRELARKSTETAIDGRRSYGVGTCVYLPTPLGREMRLIFASVASDRAPHGLRTDLATIFKVVEEVKCVIANERLSIAYIPLLGAGKGGVPPEIAFSILINALLEARCKDGGHHLKAANIVVFRPEKGDPSISARKAKRALRQLVNLYMET